MRKTFGIRRDMFAKSGPNPPGQDPPIPVKEPPDKPTTTPDAPVDDPRPEEPVRK
jgi:hypothetical protein